MFTHSIDYLTQLVSEDGAPGAVAVAGVNILFAASLFVFCWRQSRVDYVLPISLACYNSKIDDICEQDTQVYNEMKQHGISTEMINFYPKQLLELARELALTISKSRRQISDQYYSDFEAALSCLENAEKILEITITQNQHFYGG